MAAKVIARILGGGGKGLTGTGGALDEESVINPKAV